MNVQLLSYTVSPQLVCEKAAAVCVAQSCDPLRYRHLKTAMESGHLSVIEHATFTFEILCVSRVLLAQMTRHRIASFSVQSQRYSSQETSKNTFLTIPDANYIPAVEESFIRYEQLIQFGEKAEDARYILPEGTATNLVMTMNARELLHFFELRCCSRAQWEIRELANKMLALCRDAAPIIFENAGSYCKQHGYCPEIRSCGKAPRLKDLLKGAEKNEQKATPGNEE